MVLMPAWTPIPLIQATNCPAAMLSTMVMPTARSTGTSTDGNCAGFSASPKLRKKNAAKTSRSGIAMCSILLRYFVAPSTSPMRNAPIASVTPRTSPIPGEQHGEPEEQDGEQLVVLRAEQPRHEPAAPPGEGEHHHQEGERDRELGDDRPEVGLAAQHHRDDRQVDRDEDVLHDGHAEDHRRLGVRQPAQLDQQLGDDRGEEVAVIPAMISASRVPQPTQKPKPARRPC